MDELEHKISPPIQDTICVGDTVMRKTEHQDIHWDAVCRLVKCNPTDTFTVSALNGFQVTFKEYPTRRFIARYFIKVTPVAEVTFKVGDEVTLINLRRSDDPRDTSTYANDKSNNIGNVGIIKSIDEEPDGYMHIKWADGYANSYKKHNIRHASKRHAKKHKKIVDAKASKEFVAASMASSGLTKPEPKVADKPTVDMPFKVGDKIVCKSTVPKWSYGDVVCTVLAINHTLLDESQILTLDVDGKTLYWASEYFELYTPVAELATKMTENLRAKTDKPDAATFLKAAMKHMEDRAATYDQPDGERSMEKTVGAFNAITGLNMSETNGWLFMALLKMVRTEGKYHLDSLEDLAAYCGLMGESAAKHYKK